MLIIKYRIFSSIFAKTSEFISKQVLKFSRKRFMEVRAKKALGQHFLTDESIARGIVDALQPELADIDAVKVDRGVRRPATPLAAGGGARREAVGGVTSDTPADLYVRDTDGGTKMPTLEIGPGMGVISKYLLEREDLDFRMIEIDRESVDYLLSHYPKAYGRVLEGDFLKLSLDAIYGNRPFCVIGNFPYNISSQIFFRILDYRGQIPQVVCMIQKEVAERIAEKPGTKTYGILSVLLQAWYDIEYLFTVGSGAFVPPPKVQSAVIRLRRNSRTSLGCDEKLFKTVVKTAFGQRRKTLRNSLKPLIQAKMQNQARMLHGGATDPEFDNIDASTLANVLTSDPVFDLRPERLSVEDFISLTLKLQE